jgi:hypothetical protein
MDAASASPHPVVLLGMVLIIGAILIILLIDTLRR